MTASERNSLKEKIAAEIETLKADIDALRDSIKPIPPDAAIGRLTRMEMIGNKGICEANFRSAQTKLSKLESALKRIDSVDFGICVECEEPIPLKRLMIVPETLRCVHCMET